MCLPLEVVFVRILFSFCLQFSRLILFDAQKFEITGESIECTLDAPIPFNYTCKLEKGESYADVWSFEGNIPDGLLIPDMMVSVKSFDVRNHSLYGFVMAFLFGKARITTYRYLNETAYEAVYMKNTTIDVCKYSGGALSSFLIETYLPDLLVKSNLNKPCPFEVKIGNRRGGFIGSLDRFVWFQLQGKIYVDSFQLMPTLKLPRIVAGKWFVDMLIYTKGFDEFAFHVKLVIEAKPLKWYFF